MLTGPQVANATQSESLSDTLVDLRSLSSLTGFPLDLIKKELFGEESETQTVRLSRLRELMLKYLDKNHLN